MDIQRGDHLRKLLKKIQPLSSFSSSSSRKHHRAFWLCKNLQRVRGRSSLGQLLEGVPESVEHTSLSHAQSAAGSHGTITPFPPLNPMSSTLCILPISQAFTFHKFSAGPSAPSWQTEQNKRAGFECPAGKQHHWWNVKKGDH